MPCWWIAISDTARGADGIAQPLDDPRLRQAQAVARAGLFGLDQLAVLGAHGGVGAPPSIRVSAPFSIGRMRPPSVSLRKMPSTLCVLRPILRISRAS